MSEEEKIAKKKVAIRSYKFSRFHFLFKFVTRVSYLGLILCFSYTPYCICNRIVCLNIHCSIVKSLTEYNVMLYLLESWYNVEHFKWSVL